MEWDAMNPVGYSFCLGDWIDGTYIVDDDCEAILDEMIGAVLQEDKKTRPVRRRMALEKIIENELIPLIKVCENGPVFTKAVRLMANITQPLEATKNASASSWSMTTGSSATAPTSSSDVTSRSSGSMSPQHQQSPDSTSSPVVSKAVPTSVTNTGEDCGEVTSTVQDQVSPIKPTTFAGLSEDVLSLIAAAKRHCSDLDFFKSLGVNMQAILDKEPIEKCDCVSLNHCVLLLRNLFHAGSDLSTAEHSSLLHQYLLSSFFVNELDKVIFRMLNHEFKENWAIGIAQMISFLFKDYSASLLEPDIDECAKQAAAHCRNRVESSGAEESSSGSGCSGSPKLFRTPRGKPLIAKTGVLQTVDAQICSVVQKKQPTKHLYSSNTSSNNSSSGNSDEDDYLVEFKSTQDGQLEMKLTNCTHQLGGRRTAVSRGVRNGENMKECLDAEAAKAVTTTSLVSDQSHSMSEARSRSIENMDVLEGGQKGSSGSGNSRKENVEKSVEVDDSHGQTSDPNSEQSSGLVSGETSPSVEGLPEESGIDTQNALHNHLLDLSVTAGARVMDLDIIISYLKQFATEIMYSGFVDLVENIMKALLTNYYSILDHSFLIWTVGFFLSFAHQQELDFDYFKELLNLDLFGFLVYEAVISSESLEVKHSKGEDCTVEKHRVHLVVCTLNQLFRTLMAHSKLECLTNLQKYLVRMTDLHRMFVLLIRLEKTSVQGVVYLRDLVQTNHVMTLLLEEWMSRGFTADVPDFNMLDHIKQFATHAVMAKYGSLLEQTELSHDTLNVAVLTMMYHVAGDCQRQETLMQLPILKAFSEIWAENAISEHEEFNDLIEFVLQLFVSYAEDDPSACVHKLINKQAQGSGMKEENRNEDEEEDSAEDEGVEENARGHSASYGSESLMHVGSSNSSNEDLSEKEQNLIFTWMMKLEEQAERVDNVANGHGAGVEGGGGGDDAGGGGRGSERLFCERSIEYVHRHLKDYGFIRTKEQVSKHLHDNGYINISSDSPTNSSCDLSTRSASLEEMKSEDRVCAPSTSSSTSSLSSLSAGNEELSPELGNDTAQSSTDGKDDNALAQLVTKLKEKGFESQLKWLQEQLLEAAYVKLVLSDPSQRKHLEQPVAKFSALQNKSIPIVLWNDELRSALSDPYFVLLLETMGYVTKNNADVLFPRIPSGFTPGMLVEKAQQIDSIDSLAVKFDVNAIKEDISSTSLNGDHSSSQMPGKAAPLPCENGTCNCTFQSVDIMWLNAIQKLNGDMEMGST